MIDNYVFDFLVDRIKVRYEDSEGDKHTVILQFIYCIIEKGKMYVWLTDKNKVNLVEVNGGMKKYSVRYDSEEDILKYIEEYLTEDGYVSNLDIDYDYCDDEVEEFEQEISIFEFSGSAVDYIKNKSLIDEYEFWIDSGDKYYTNIYLLQISTGNMRLVAKLINNDMYDYEEYCVNNINESTQYFFDKI